MSHESKRAVRTVLVVDDQEDTRVMLDEGLTKRGFLVSTAKTGREGLELLREKGADAIVLDLWMPDLDGWDFRVIQKSEPAIAAVPVVIMSADESSRARAVDAALFIKKPIDALRLAEELERLLDSLEGERARAMRLARVERLASLGTLAAGVAHEINNPLTYITTNLEYAIEELGPQPTSTEVAEALREALHGARRVASIVRDLKFFARAGELEVERIDIAQVIEAALRMTAPQVRLHASITSSVSPDLAAVGDAGRLTQVIVNLVMNAAQAVPLGTARANEVHVRARADDDTVVIEVMDTGPGVDASIRDRIFEPFYTTKPLGAGNGLGLAISAGLVRSMGGSLVLAADVLPPWGSLFRVLLPAAPNDAAVAAPSLVVAPRPARARLLIIDDEPAVVRALTRSLSADHEIVTADGATAALALLTSTGAFDVVLCDLMMPDGTGADIYSVTHARFPELAARFVFFTGASLDPSSSAFLDSVPNELVNKPVSARCLRRAIGRVLARQSA